MKFTAYQFIKPVNSLIQNLSDATANGAVVDRKGFHECMVRLALGTMGGTTPSVTVKIQTGDASDLSDAADLASATFGAKTAAGLFTGSIDLTKSTVKRYLRCVATISGTSPTGEICVDFILMGAQTLPVSQVVTNTFSV